MKHISQFPHCDQRILHAPEDNCTVCNMHPEWQELRKMWGIAFTGHSYDQNGKLFVENGHTILPCPAESNRGMKSINSWGGNIAYTPEVEEARAAYFRQVNKEVRERLHEQFPDIHFDDDFEIGGEG
jgi:hypothetical protein